jgi:hypothetical protein
VVDISVVWCVVMKKKRPEEDNRTAIVDGAGCSRIVEHFVVTRFKGYF